MKPVFDWKHARRVLIVKWSAMGDVAIATALMEDVCRACPDAEVDLNVMPAYLDLFAEDKRFRQVFAIDLRGKDRGWRGMRKWLREVKLGGYDGEISNAKIL